MTAPRLFTPEDWLRSRQSYRRTLDARFWERMDRTGDCWIWLGAHNSSGYGTFMRARKYVFAHREAYERTNGSIPDGLIVMHTCDNPPCCNPDHLIAGTQSQNILDSWSRGRRRGISS